jgi:hypothetical protein
LNQHSRNNLKTMLLTLSCFFAMSGTLNSELALAFHNEIIYKSRHLLKLLELKLGTCSTLREVIHNGFLFC